MDGPSISQGREKELGGGVVSLLAAGPWTSCSTDALVRPITCPSENLLPFSPGESWLQQGKASAAFPSRACSPSLLLTRNTSGHKRERGETGQFPFLS